MERLRCCVHAILNGPQISLSLSPPSLSLSLTLCQFDMAIVELHENSTSNAIPAQLYDGGDLGISDCKKMQLSYLSWASTGNCSNTDPNFVDSEGDTCDTWEKNPTWCIGSPEDGVVDEPAKYAVGGQDPSQMCCVCGGGTRLAADFSPQMTTVQLTDHKTCQVGTPFMCVMVMSPAASLDKATGCLDVPLICRMSL
jgi:hypothetical protein